MNGKLLDTNIIVALFAEDAAVLNELNATAEVFTPSIVLGELYFGAQKSGRVEANMNRVDDWEQSNVILDCDAQTARFYAIIKNELRIKGKPIAENDAWIAAIALRHDLTLVTRDAHFGNAEVLRTELW